MSARKASSSVGRCSSTPAISTAPLDEPEDTRQIRLAAGGVDHDRLAVEREAAQTFAQSRLVDQREPDTDVIRTTVDPASVLSSSGVPKRTFLPWSEQQDLVGECVRLRHHVGGDEDRAPLALETPHVSQMRCVPCTSTPSVGSSSSRMRGSASIARPSARRRFMPPE